MPPCSHRRSRAWFVEGADRPPVADLAWAVAELADEAAERRPLVIVVDDAHWADDEVGTVLDEVVRHATWPLLIIRTVLPEFVSSDDDVITVPPLSEPESRSLLQGLAGEVPGEEDVVRHAEGNPLFLIETARMVRDRVDLDEGAGPLEVPTTIRGLIAARLEHLPVGEVRVLETASAIGRVFPLDAVASLGRMDAD